MDAFPSVVRIEPAGVCNFKCTHCLVGRHGGAGRIMSFDTFVRIFEILPAVPRVLVLYHAGEPLLNKHLELMVNYAHVWGVEKIVFNTNASMITPDRDLSQVDELRVSFDGASAAENDKIRTNSNFEQDAYKVKRLALSNMRPTVIKIYNVQKDTDKPAKYLRDYFADCPGVEFEGFRMREWARAQNEPQPTNGARYCKDLFESFTITSNGNSVKCCEDLLQEDVTGNVYGQSPLEIWQSMQPIRDAFKRGDYPKQCQSCWVLTRGAEKEKVKPAPVKKKAKK